jgi:hypothetical protein
MDNLYIHSEASLVGTLYNLVNSCPKLLLIQIQQKENNVTFSIAAKSKSTEKSGAGISLNVKDIGITEQSLSLN